MIDLQRISSTQRRRQRRQAAKRDGTHELIEEEIVPFVVPARRIEVEVRDIGAIAMFNRALNSATIGTTANPVLQKRRLDLIYQAVSSLYKDRIKPKSSDVCFRLKEIVSSRNLEDTLFVKQKDLKSIAHGNPKIFIVDEDLVTNEIFVFLTRPPVGFRGWVDPKATRDPFSDVVWKNILLYVSSLLAKKNDERWTSDDTLRKYQFKGGRYGLACALLEHSAFQNMRLGEIAHLVQLAISKSVLSYENSVLQPLAACEERTGAYVHKQEMRTPEKAAERAALLNTVIGHTSELLIHHMEGIELAEISRFLYSKYQITLKPEMLGVNKMMDLFALPEMEIHFRLFSIENEHKIRLQSKIFSMPTDGTLIDTNAKKAAEPQVSCDMWSPPEHMLKISYFFEKQRAPVFIVPLKDSASQEEDPRMKKMKTRMMSPTKSSSISFPEICIDEFGIVEFDFTVLDQNDLADEIFIEELLDDLNIPEADVHYPGNMDVEDSEAGGEDDFCCFFSSEQMLFLEDEQTAPQDQEYFFLFEHMNNIDDFYLLES